MTRVNFSAISQANVEDLIANLCEEDRIEILGTGAAVDWGIRSTVEASTQSCAARTKEGEVICLFGVTTENALLGEASPWFLSTNLIYKYRREVAIFAKPVLDKWLADYGLLTNYVDSRHARAISWLQHMGATFEEIPAFGIYRRPYYKFTIGH